MKTGKIIKIVVSSLIGIIVAPIILVTFILVIKSYIEPDHIADIFGVSPVVVIVDDAQKDLYRGDLIFIHDVNIDDIEKGNNVVYGARAEDGTMCFIGGMIDEVVTDDNTFAIDLFKDAKKGLVAPGSKGQVVLKVKNDSQVPAEFNMKGSLVNGDYYDETDNIPLTFSVGNNEGYVDASRALGNLLPHGILQPGESQTVTLDWQWAAIDDDAHNTYDTSLAIMADTPEAVASFTINAKQVIE